MLPDPGQSAGAGRPLTPPSGAEFLARYEPKASYGRGRGGGGAAALPGGGAPPGKLFDRDPPFSLEAEMSLLGSILLDPRIVTDVMAVLRTGGVVFYNAAHGVIYDAIVKLCDKHNAVDPVLLAQELADKGVLEHVGGADYLVNLASQVPTANNAPHFARIILEKHRLRRLIDAAGQTLWEAYNAGQMDIEGVKQLVDAAEQRVFEIAQEEQISETETLEALLHKEYDRLMAMEGGQSGPSGVLTGFLDLDTDLGGLQPGELIIVAARPSMGKTALMLNMAEQIALGTDQPASTRPVRERAPIGVFSLEMSKSAITQRLISAWTGISSHKLRSGHLTRGDYDVLMHTAQQLGDAPMYCDDTPGLSITALRARARRMVAQYKVRVLMVDYLQLLTAPAQARESRQVEVSAISRGVKALARELNVPIIALSQLNRGPEGREGNRPRLSDLRESGSLEQDADVVLLLHREEYYHIQDPQWAQENPDKVGIAEIIIAKQRNGPTGVTRLTWEAETTRFKNLSDAHYAGPVTAPAAPAPVAAPMAARPGTGGGGGWHAGRGTGPVANHRDGGGPDREAPVAPATTAPRPTAGEPAQEVDAFEAPDEADELPPF